MEIKDRTVTITRTQDNIFRIDIDGIDVLNPVRTIYVGNEIRIRLPIATYKTRIAYINENP